MEPSQLSSVFTFESASLTQTPLDIDTERIRLIWGTNINVTETTEQFRDYLRTQPLTTHTATFSTEYYLDCQPLYGTLIYEQLVKYPTDTIPILENALNDAFQEISPGYLPVKLFVCNVNNLFLINDVCIDKLDQLVQLRGTVVRVSAVEAECTRPVYRCAHCNSTDSPTPEVCTQCGTKYALQIDTALSTYVDKQIIRVQDSICNTPSSVAVATYEIDVAVPGDNVVVVGVLKPKTRSKNNFKNLCSSRFDIFIDSVLIRKETEVSKNDTESNRIGTEINSASFNSLDYIDAIRRSSNRYEILVSLVAPHIYGLDDVKKSILLQLLGGVEKQRGNMKIRGTINILLAGDPGTSKSRLLSFVHGMTRGIYTSGTGSSAVGLTAAVVREEDRFVLTPGALVLSDGGVCCIDEFDKMDVEIKSVLHEVMEQQTISISKAGIITSLNCRCSILACCNPVESKYNCRKTIVENINVIPSLLSRFDVVCLIVDNHEEDNDKRVAQHILSGVFKTRDYEDSVDNELSNDTAYMMLNSLTESQKIVVLRDYIEEAKRLKPVILSPAKLKLCDSYCELRQLDNGKSITATTRQLESLIRLSEAHARSRLSNTVDEVDVEEALRLIKDSLLLYAVDPLTGKIDMDLVLTGRSTFKSRVAEDLKKEIKSALKGRMSLDELAMAMNVELKKITAVVKEMVDEGVVYWDKKDNYVEKII